MSSITLRSVYFRVTLFGQANQPVSPSKGFFVAISEARDVVVDQQFYNFFAASVEPKPDYVDGKRSGQKTSDDGVDQWVINCVRTPVTQGASRAATLAVTVTAEDAPEVFGSVVFEDLVARQWSTKTGPGGGLAFSASSVHAV